MNAIEAWKKAKVGDKIYRKSVGFNKSTGTYTVQRSDFSVGGSTHAFIDTFAGDGPEAYVFDFWMLADDWEILPKFQERRIVIHLYADGARIISDEPMEG